ncbi:MAG: GAF domain-containing sensor histidine kinase [Syntrophaceae bacterium]|nr:GAF domain-containing sensor histidine kinase [Syntrophaceae bacterium]
MDTERVGYARAVQGFRVEDVLHVYEIFQKVLVKIFQEAVTQEMIEISLYKEVEKLNQILLQCITIVSTSFLKTREEMITEKVSHLQNLFDFTQEIVKTFDLEKIANHILTKMTSLFCVEGSILVICREEQIQQIYNYPSQKEFSDVMSIVKKMLSQKTPFFIDEEGDIYREISSFLLKRVVSVPIQIHGQCYGILTLCNGSKGFKFTNKELELLYQFIYIMGVALENAFMLEEIEQGRQELRLLTNKMITLQEEERKRLAEDIHDTLAQTLTGIGYKIQFCKELLKRNPALLMVQFDSLIENINHAIDQSREIISSLRPDLIDTMGLVPALKRYIENFMQETDIRVIMHLPKRVKLSSGVRICLFRIVQEALTNVYKHAETKVAEVTLRQDKENIFLIIEDRGRGFNPSHRDFRRKDQGTLGLLSMKERLEAIGGIFAIHTGLNKGCRIEAKIPLSEE